MLVRASSTLFPYTTLFRSVPKISVIVRKAYGAGLYAMAGPAFEPDCCIALPSAQIAVMGPEAAVNAVYANKIAARSEEHTSELQSRGHLVCRLLLEKKKQI